MTVVTEQLDLPGPPNSTPTLPGAARSLVGITLVGSASTQIIGYGPGSTIVGERDVYPSSDGTWSLDLVPNSLINPVGTVYRIEYSPLLAKQDVFISVPVTGGPFLVEELLVHPPGEVASAALTLFEQTHGLEHDWDTEGWASFTPVVMTADAPQAFTQASGNGRGTLAGTVPTNGSLRVAYLLNGTYWTDTEATTLVLPPTGWVDGGAQQGHIHRVREVSPGLWEGIAIWSSVFGSDYRGLHVKCVRFDGTNLLQSAGFDGVPADVNFIDRAMRVRAARRFTFGNVLQEYKIAELEYLRQIALTERVDVIEMADVSFNESSVPVTGIDQAYGGVTIIDPAAGGAVAEASVFAGRVLPDSNTNQKRWTPHWLSTRVRGGSASSVLVEIKRWRPEDGEPDWGSSQVFRQAVTPNASIDAMALGPGSFALWGAHFLSTSSGSWGGLRVTRL